MNFIQTLIGLPDEAKLAIGTVVTALLTWVAMWLLAKTGFNFSGYVGALSAVISGVIVALLEKYLALIPSVFDSVVLAIIHVLVLALGGGALYWLAKRKTARNLFVTPSSM